MQGHNNAKGYRQHVIDNQFDQYITIGYTSSRALITLESQV